MDESYVGKVKTDRGTARKLLFTAPRRKRAGRRAVPGSEGSGGSEG